MTPSWRARLRRLRFALLAAAATVVILLGVLAGLTQLAMPWLERNPQYVERWLSQRLDRPVKIERLSGAVAEATQPATDLPRDVLLVEDNVIIALDTEAILTKLGVADVRVANSVAAALKIIDERPPLFALLDVNLGVETSFEIAEKLVELKIPFAFATGYGEQIAFPRELAAIPKLSKPYSGESLQQLMRRAAAGTGRA